MEITEQNLHRINNDVNGNPRYVLHYILIDNCTYNEALSKCRQLGGKKFNNKQFGGGIVFQCYNTGKLVNDLNNLNK